MAMAVLAPQLAVCPEYQRLLESCQRSLAVWQQRRTLAERGSFANERVRSRVERLQTEYERAYALLEHHEQTCQTCQYISKVGGLDFESMSAALNR